MTANQQSQIEQRVNEDLERVEEMLVVPQVPRSALELARVSAATILGQHKFLLLSMQ